MKITLRHNRPDLVILPDGRKRVTLVYDAREWTGRTLTQIVADLTVARGSAGPDDYSALRLVAQKIEGTAKNVEKGSIPVIREYEEIPETAEVQVGANTVTLLEDGRKAIEADFIQLSSANATPGMVGTTTAPGDNAAYLQQEVAENNGTVRSIKRTYIYEGTLTQSDESKNGGKLLIRTLVSVKTVPATPAGYTLVKSDTKNPDGIPIHTYVFAKGAGRVATDVSYRQNGKLKITTIRYLNTDDGVTPTGTLIDDDSKTEDGYTLFIKGYAEIVGDGIVLNETDSKHAGKLKIYHIVKLGSAPSAPAATIGGTVVSVTTRVRQEDYFDLYDYTWAEGEGEISRDTQSKLNGMLQRVVIRHLTATSVTVQPTTDPLSGGSVKSDSRTDQDGYRLWEVLWVKVNTTQNIIDTAQKQNNGKLVIYRRSKLGAAPSAPAATIGGTVIETDSGERQEEDYTVYSKEWAEGQGVIKRNRQDRELGLRLENWQSLGQTFDAGTMQPPGILLMLDEDEVDGGKLFSATCVQNSAGVSPLQGTSIDRLEMVSPGNYDYGSVPAISFVGGGGSGATATPVLSGGTTGFITSITLTAPGTGYTSPPEVVIGTPNSDTPVFAAILSGVAVRRERIFDFTYPGRAQAVDLAHPDVASSHNLEIQLSPPIDEKVFGVEEISYRTDEGLQDLTYPLWNPREWATIFAQYLAPGVVTSPVSRCEGLRGYRAVGGVSKIDVTYAATGLVTVMGAETAYSSGKKAYLKVFGGPDAPDNQTFTLDAESELAFIGYDGTKYFRRRVGYALIPPQNPIPAMSSVDIISTSVTSIATLKAVATTSAVAGARTNAFMYRWTFGGLPFVKLVRPTLVAGALGVDSTFKIKPTDYAGGSNEKYWLLA